MPSLLGVHGHRKLLPVLCLPTFQKRKSEKKCLVVRYRSMCSARSITPHIFMSPEDCLNRLLYHSRSTLHYRRLYLRPISLRKGLVPRPQKIGPFRRQRWNGTHLGRSILYLPNSLSIYRIAVITQYFTESLHRFIRSQKQ